MKLDYCILWFDDQPRAMESYKTALARILKNLGFNLKTEFRSSFSKKDMEDLSSQLEKYNPYDMVLCDHNLGNGITGAQIASQLRRIIYTDMVYYSAADAQVLRSSLYKAEVDGVHITSRTTFNEDMERILEDQVKKFCDINNMRGIVLDEMSEIDFKLRELLLKMFASWKHEQKGIFLDDLKKKYLSRANDTMKAREEVQLANVHTHITEKVSLVDFEILRTRIYKNTKKNSLFKDESPLHEMQKLRNKLAHQKAELDSEKNEIVIGAKERFDHSRFKDIRIQLGKLKTELNAFEKEYFNRK